MEGFVPFLRNLPFPCKLKVDMITNNQKRTEYVSYVITHKNKHYFHVF